MSGNPRRLNDLEERFAALASDLPESPQTRAISVLHGMIQELRRGTGPAAPAGHGVDGRHEPDGTDGSRAAGPTRGEVTLADIANLHKSAPSMSGPSENEPLLLRTTAPDFSLPDANGNEVSLSDFRGRPVVLVFYPLDWSPTCSDQVSLYEAEKDEFARFGAQVVGISVDSVYSHGAWAAVRGLSFPLLADFEPKGVVARRYHVYRARDGFSERALYVIDADGLIRYACVSPQLDRIPEIYELYGALAEVTGMPAPSTSATPISSQTAVAVAGTGS